MAGFNLSYFLDGVKKILGTSCCPFAAPPQVNILKSTKISVIIIDVWYLKRSYDCHTLNEFEYLFLFVGIYLTFNNNVLRSHWQWFKRKRMNSIMWDCKDHFQLVVNSEFSHIFCTQNSEEFQYGTFFVVSTNLK